MITIFNKFKKSPEISINDIVKCISNTKSEIKLLEVGKLYKIENIKQFRNTYMYKLYNIVPYMNSNRFILATPEETTKYKLEQSANKYNI